MLILRPVRITDLDQVYALSSQTTYGMETLPHDRALIAEKIEASVSSFRSPPEKPGAHLFFFVLEDLEAKKVVGTSAITSKIGGDHPFWTFEVKSMADKTEVFKEAVEADYLQLKAVRNGPSKIGTLFLSPVYRRKNHGRLLSLGRFLFVSAFRHCFEDQFIVELRGVIDDNGKTEFWDALGRRFFSVSFEQATLTVTRNKSIIAETMPKNPIYLPSLPFMARRVIGRIHKESKPARKILQQEGFTFMHEIDILEAGPVDICATEQIRTVRKSRTGRFSMIREVDGILEDFLISRVCAANDFRVCVGKLEICPDNSVTLSEKVAIALSLKPGDIVRYVPVR